MKKTASFIYAVIFALAMALIAVFTVVLIGKYDYSWEYREDIPQINPEYVGIDTSEAVGTDTSTPTVDLKAILELNEVSGWDLFEDVYKCNLKITETHGGTAKISYIEYTLYENNICYGVYYESFENETHSDKAVINGNEIMNWKVELPFNNAITLLKVKVVWADEEGNIGENTMTVDYGPKFTEK